LKQQEKDNQQKEEREDEIRINSVLFATALRTSLAVQNIQSELFVYIPGARRMAGCGFLDELDFVMKVKSKRRNYFWKRSIISMLLVPLFLLEEWKVTVSGMMSPTGIIRRRDRQVRPMKILKERITS